MNAELKLIVEALLLAADRALSADEILSVFDEADRPGRNELRQALDGLAADCEHRGVELKQVASGYRLQIRQELAGWVSRLWEEKPPRYTRALLETLAIIAYRQPATRGNIQEVRGVAVSAGIIRTLLDREWIRIAGYRETPGRPEEFVTTRRFLDHFNLKDLSELPPLAEAEEPREALLRGGLAAKVRELFPDSVAADLESAADPESAAGNAAPARQSANDEPANDT